MHAIAIDENMSDFNVLLECALAYQQGNPYDLNLIDNIWFADTPKEDAEVICEYDDTERFCVIAEKYRILLKSHPNCKLTRMNNKNNEIRWAIVE